MEDDSQLSCLSDPVSAIVVARDRFEKQMLISFEDAEFKGLVCQQQADVIYLGLVLRTKDWSYQEHGQQGSEDLGGGV